MKNVGNVAVGGHSVTDPSGKKWYLEGDKTVLQPGETGSIAVKYNAGRDKDVTFTTSVSNQKDKTLTYKGQYAKITWGDLTFSGRKVDAKTPINVKANSQLLFQLEVTNTGNVPTSAITVKLPNGELFTTKQTAEPGKKTNINIPYTPAKGETNLTFTASFPGQENKTYTATINPENTPPTPTTTKPAPATPNTTCLLYTSPSPRDS